MRTPLTSLLTISYILRTTYCLLIPAGAGVAVKSSFYFLLLTTYLVLLTTYYLLLTPGAVVAISISLSISISIAIVSLSLFLSLSLSLSPFLSLSIHVILFLFCGHLVLFCLDFLSWRAVRNFYPLNMLMVLLGSSPYNIMLRRRGWLFRWLRMRFVWGLRKSSDASQPVNL